MKGRFITAVIAGAFAAAVLAAPAIAGKGGNGNGAPEGAHYNLNILGKEEGDKLPKMTGTNRHTIFVPLQSTGSGKYARKNFNTDGSKAELPATEIVDSLIWLVPGWDFTVCDGNGFDPAYDGCDVNFDETYDANQVYWDVNGVPHNYVGSEKKMGAVFMLPCNSNFTADADTNFPCDGGADGNIRSYGVWAKALGSGGSATLTTCAFDSADELICSLENEILTAIKGKADYKDVTDELTSLLISECDDTVTAGVCDGSVTTTRYALFAGGTYDWFWNYNNNGLRLAQLRFYVND